MRVDRKYLVAVALLAFLAIVFGLAGTVAPVPELASPQQSSSLSSSDSMTHFMNPPTFDSDWVDITDKCGQYFNVTHDLNTREVFVDMVGRQSLTEETLADGEHQRNIGGTIVVPGWSRTYGGPLADAAYSVVQTLDGGYAIAGYTYPAGNPDFWLVKTDWAGDMIWNRTYGGASRDVAWSVVQTLPEEQDAGYALAGYTQSYGAGLADFWLVKTFYNGYMNWSRTYGGLGWDYAWSLIWTVDGGYALAGHTDSYGAGDYDFWLVKTNSNGIMLWSRTYGGTNCDKAYSAVQTSDGGYALAGCTNSSGARDHDFWLVKTDSVGNPQWNRTYGGASRDVAWSLIQTLDGGYALAGCTNFSGAGDYDFWLVKTDASGNMQWNKTYGRPTADEAHCVIQTLDGGYAIVGHTVNAEWAEPDFLLVKTDSYGTMLWNRTYGGVDWDMPWSLIQTLDEGYTIAGFTLSYDGGDFHFWLVKTDVEMGLTWTRLTAHNITLYRGRTDPYWNYVRVRIWTIEEPTWQFGDINQDGVVDIQDLYILSQNYGKTFSALSLGGMVTVAGIHTYKKRKQPK